MGAMVDEQGCVVLQRLIELSELKNKQTKKREGARA